MSLPALLFPVFNPDLFWHLSAGQWILAHKAVPQADWLSFTRAGAPWLDFEWLPQAAAALEYGAAGLGGLWLLKCALMAACLLALMRVLPGGPVGAALLALWSAGAVAHSDLRPELLSLLFLLALFDRLERRRAARAARWPKLDALAVGGLFAAWSNAHAAFVLGWALLAVYAAELFLRGRRDAARDTAVELGLAIGATIFNPYGLGPHLVAWRHWRQGSELSMGIVEWRPMDFSNPLHYPFWLLAGLLAAALLSFAMRRRKDAPWAPLLYAGALVVATLGHTRFFMFANAAAVVALGAAFPRLPKAACAAALAACAAFALRVLPKTDWRGPFNPKFVPVRAAEFMDRERAVFEPLRLYNQWEWGGYLRFRLPWRPVFADGRYIFHDLLPVMREASQDPEAWARFLADRRLTAAAVANLDVTFPSTRRYPDGTTKDFRRPWYLSFYPRADWALVYWDEQAMLFARRGAVPADWLEAHEYRLVRPRDDAAFLDALNRGELDQERLAQERFRHEKEEDIARRCRWGDACAWRP